jgi:monolysocardiolipin acyltransferase
MTDNIVKKQLKEWPTLLTLNNKFNKSRLKWKLGSKIVVPTIGLLSKLWTDLLNKSHVKNHFILLETLSKHYNNNHKKPLITISNHSSCMDDPLMWGTLIPFKWQFNSGRHRWSAAAQEVCFTTQLHSLFFSLGKTFPIIRGNGIYQPAMDFALDLLRDGHWLHFFPEGKVMIKDNNKDNNLITSRLDVDINVSEDIEREAKPSYELKWGLARLILDHVFNDNTSKELEVLPIYHLGMDDILPTKEPYIPRINKRVTFYVRDDGPIHLDRKSLSQLIGDITSLSSKDKRIKIMQFFENEMNLLKAKAIKLHYGLENIVSIKE